MKNNIIIFSNFNLIDNSQIWKNKNFNYNINFEYIYDSNFSAFKKLDTVDVKQVIILIYVNDFFNINFIKASKFFIKLIKKKPNIYFNFFFIIKNFKNNILNQQNNNKFIQLLNVFNINNLTNFKYSILLNDFSKNFNLRNEVLLKMPIEYSFLKKLSKKIYIEIKNYFAKPFKIIFLDCDNTLWGGVSSEDGYHNIEYSTGSFGIIYEKLQEHLLNLKKQGFILTLVSKNEEKTVWDTLKKRKMLLQKKDFISPKINWLDKSINIQNTLNELNLRAADSIFIDDNVVEVLKVKKSIKGISSLNSKDIVKCYESVLSNPRLQKNAVLKEDIQKYKQYKLKDNFLKLSNKIINDDVIFKKLKQKIYFQQITKLNLGRADQLFNKTNQFNISLNRKTKNQIIKISRNKKFIIKLFGLKDIYGDHGLIGAFIMKKEKQKYFLEDFLISCRVIERYVEYYVINKIFEFIKKDVIIIKFNLKKSNQKFIKNFINNLLSEKQFLKNEKGQIIIKNRNSLLSYKKFFNN